MSDELVHPSWSLPRRCTAAAAPVNGHAVGEHRGRPAGRGELSVQLCQTPRGEPHLVLSRGGAELTVPLSEAAGLGDAVADLLDEARER